MAEDYIVRGMSRLDIERKAIDFLFQYDRQSLEVDQDPVDVEKLLDCSMYLESGYMMELVPDQNMYGNVEAMTSFSDRVIEIRESDFNALQSPGRARFTVCHEIGHALLHTDQLENITIEESRSLKLCRQKEDIPSYRSADWQAEAFASALLMPAPTAITIFKEMSAEGWADVMIVQAFIERFKVSWKAAEVRLKIIKQFLSNGRGNSLISYFYNKKDSVTPITESL